MQFKAVTGSGLDAFDEETRELYKKRTNDPRLSYMMSVAPRKQRNHLPVLVETENNELMQKLQKDNTNFPWRLMGMFIVFSFCSQQFAKSYYPYGIIARRSMVVSPQKKALMYAPILAFFGWAWWSHKEKPRSQRSDFTSPDE